MTNALTIDVEDYWSIFSRDWLHIDAEHSDAVVKNTEWFLETLAQGGTKATFFILGDVARSFPSLISRIAQAGHEIGSHGLSHLQIFRLSKEQFRSEIADSKKLLEDIISGPVFGYRAPAFSVMPTTQWALDVLAKEGFKYDSSVFPISGRRYGWPGFSTGICKIDLSPGRTIIEVPISTVTVFGKTLPVAGGGYIRHFPYAFTKWAVKRIEKTRPAIVYLHPYDIDTEDKVFNTDQLSCEEKTRAMRFHKMQKRNRNTVAQKLIRLISEFEFCTVSKVIDRTIINSSVGVIGNEV